MSQLITPKKTIVFPDLICGFKGGGKGGGGGSPRAAVEAPNTLQSNSVARLIDVLGEGDIAGLVNGAKSIFLDKTALQNTDGSYNFEGVTWALRTGTASQTFVSGFSAVESEYSVGAEVKYGKPITRAIDNPEIDAVRVTVQVTQLYSQNKTNGDMNGTFVQTAFELSCAGGPFSRVLTRTISGKTMSAYQEQYRIKLPAGGAPWNIRMVRLTADSDSSSLQNGISWASFTTIIDSKISYANTAYIALTVKASQFGSNIPARAYEVYGRIIQVPSNYDPNTRSYSGLWDGKFKKAYSNNNAWVLYDMMTHGRFGLGRELPASLIDKWELYTIGRYCDELVPDGKGGMEPRFTFNGSCCTREDAMSFLGALGGTCRTKLFPAVGGIFFTQDRPCEVKRILAPANVLDGRFTYEGTAWSSRHSLAQVSWLDPDNGYETDILSVEDPEMIRQFGWRPLDVIAFGCTSPGQAWRTGMMALDAEKYATEVVNFSTGLDCADLAPGDVVAINDPSHAGARAGGRILQCDKKTATLDAPFKFDDAESYKLGLIMPDNKIIEVPIINSGQETSIAEFEEDLSSLPLPGAVYGILASNLNARKFRILSVEQGEGLTFNFSAILYDQTKYDRVEKDIDLPPIPTTLFPSGPLELPTDLSYKEYLYLKTGLSPMAGATVSWSCKDARAVAFEIEWQEPGQNGFQGKNMVSTPSFDIDVKMSGLYIFRVRSINGFGQHSGWAQLGANMQGLSATPDDVKKFEIYVTGELMTLSWELSQKLNVSHYEIRFTPLIISTNSWEQSAVLRSNIGVAITSVQLPLQHGTFLIKAINVMGIGSQNAAAVINEISIEALHYNVVQVTTQNPAWTGTKSNVELKGSTLILAQKDATSFHPQGIYTFAPIYQDLGKSYPAKVVPELIAAGVGLTDNIFSEPNIFNVENIFSLSKSQDWQCWLEFSATNDDPAQSEAVWTNWAKRQEPFNHIARAYKFRLILKSLNGVTTPVVGAAAISIDMEDRMSSGQNLAVPFGGLAVKFVPPFREIPALTISVQSALAGDEAAITNKSKTGFTVRIRDAQKDWVSGRTIDWIARGFGNEKIA